MTMYTFLKSACIFAVSLALIIFLLEATHLAMEARSDLATLTQQASVSLTQFNATEKQSSAKLEAEQKELLKITGALKLLIDTTNVKLFGRDLRHGLFGQAQSVLDSGNTLLVDADFATKQAAETLAQASEDLHATVLELKPSLEALAKDLADPALPETIHHLDETSANLAADTAELQRMLESGTATAQDIQRVADKVADEYTKTRNLAYAVFKELLGIGAQGVQFFLKK